MTLFTIAALLLSGMKTFDSVTLAMGAAGTGGFAVLKQRLCSVHTTAAVDSDNRHDCVRCEFLTFYYLMLCKKGKGRHFRPRR